MKKILIILVVIIGLIPSLAISQTPDEYREYLERNYKHQYELQQVNITIQEKIRKKQNHMSKYNDYSIAQKKSLEMMQEQVHENNVKIKQLNNDANYKRRLLNIK